MKGIIIGVFCIFTSACATQTQLEKALSADRTLVEKTSIELIGDQGYTQEEISGKWISYWAPDGRKVVLVKGKEPKELQWRVNDDGVFCEEYYSQDGKEICGDPVVRVRNSDGTYSDFTKGKESTFGRYRIVVGNPNKF